MSKVLNHIIQLLREERGEKTVKHGERTIKIELHFWTNDIASERGKVVPKVCWDSGMIHVLKNEGHGIERLGPVPFNSLSELELKLEEAFKKAGIVVLKSKEKPYYPK